MYENIGFALVALTFVLLYISEEKENRLFKVIYISATFGFILLSAAYSYNLTTTTCVSNTIINTTQTCTYMYTPSIANSTTILAIIIVLESMLILLLIYKFFTSSAKIITKLKIR